MNTYREEVRSEMMQTQLDDRHDILGNTIYRLAFDATVLAGREAGTLGLVSVVLHYDPREYRADYAVAYRDWLRYVQRIANDAVDGLAKSFAGRTLEPRVRIQLPFFLVGAVCKSIELANGRAPTAERCDMWSTESTDSTDLAQGLLSSYVSQYLEQRAEIVKARFERDLRAAAASRGLKSEHFPYAFDFANRDCNSRQTLTTYVQEIGGQTVEVNCPLFTLPDEGLVAGLTLYDYLVTHPSALVGHVRDPQTRGDPKAIAGKLLTASVTSSCDPAHRATCITPDLTPAQFGCAAAEYYVWRLNASGDPRAPENQRIGSFLDLKPVGRQVQDCALKVTPLSGPESKKQDGGDPNTDAVAHLSDSLNVSNEVYAYSVTPRNLSERVSTTTDIRNAVQLLLGAKAGMGTADAASMSNMIRKRAEDIQAIEQHPIVVGFGESRGKGSSTPPYETSFGWALAPHLGSNGAQVQVDEQYGLAALISVPSWWRSVKLEIRTCWVNRKDLQPLLDKPKDICPGSPVRTDIVRLPGVANDISQKLGFEFVQEPHLTRSRSTRSFKPAIPEISS
jgi:hypothetical protein